MTNVQCLMPKEWQSTNDEWAGRAGQTFARVRAEAMDLKKGNEATKEDTREVKAGPTDCARLTASGTGRLVLCRARGLATRCELRQLAVRGRAGNDE